VNPVFWTLLGELVSSSRVVIDRPRGSAYPCSPENIYLLDYDSLKDTTSGDGQGIDVWLGSADTRHLSAVLVGADLKKRDAELKLLPGCTPAEAQAVQGFLNSHASFQCLLIARPVKEKS
jgi:inorganic pyrophosphatase